MNLKNYFLKKKQLKAMQKTEGDLDFYLQTSFRCPKCYWGTDELTAYTTHLENHLITKKQKKNRGDSQK